MSPSLSRVAATITLMVLTIYSIVFGALGDFLAASVFLWTAVGAQALPLLERYKVVRR